MTARCRMYFGAEALLKTLNHALWVSTRNTLADFMAPAEMQQQFSAKKDLKKADPVDLESIRMLRFVFCLKLWPDTTCSPRLHVSRGSLLILVCECQRRREIPDEELLGTAAEDETHRLH